jgi:hypothetical protein
MIRRAAVAAICGTALAGLATVPAHAAPAPASRSARSAGAAAPLGAGRCITGWFCQGNWYSDATFTTVVGGFTFPCGGREVAWGTVTQWSQITDFGTCD